jgi:hypothetical protein
MESLTTRPAFQLARTGTLVVSSDGLARGHDASVFDKLRDLAPLSGFPALPREHGAALDVLVRCAAFADTEHARGDGNLLFNDNLSLVLIRAKEKPDGKS